MHSLLRPKQDSQAVRPITWGSPFFQPKASALKKQRPQIGAAIESPAGTHDPSGSTDR